MKDKSQLLYIVGTMFQIFICMVYLVCTWRHIIPNYTQYSRQIL